MVWNIIKKNVLQIIIEKATHHPDLAQKYNYVGIVLTVILLKVKFQKTER